jgi:hypothetical protein
MRYIKAVKYLNTAYNQNIAFHSVEIQTYVLYLEIFFLHSSFKMKLSASLVSTLLLFIPSLVSAAPTETNRSLFARDGQTCVPKTLAANDVEGKRRQKEILDKMHAATREAHEGEDACKAQKNTEFNQSKDKKKRTEIKNTCTAGWQKYAFLNIKQICHCLPKSIDALLSERQQMATARMLEVLWTLGTRKLLNSVKTNLLNGKPRTLERRVIHIYGSTCDK